MVRTCSLKPPLQRDTNVQVPQTHLEQLQPVLHLPVLQSGDEPHDDVERQQDPTSPEQVYLQRNTCQNIEQCQASMQNHGNKLTVNRLKAY